MNQYSNAAAQTQAFKPIELFFEAAANGVAKVHFQDLDFTQSDLNANKKRIVAALKQACFSSRGILDKDLYKPQHTPVLYEAGQTVHKPWELIFTLDAVQCTDEVIDSKTDAIMQRVSVELTEYQWQTKGGAL